MSNDRKDDEVDTLPAADGWVDDPVREAPDAPLVPAGRAPTDGPTPSPTDELWLDKNEFPRSARGMSVPRPIGQEAPKPRVEPLADIDSGKAMAILAHCSMVLGLPIFLVPLLQADNAFALHHAKAAGVNFLFFLGFFGLAFATCGISVPLIFLCYIPAFVGIINAANGHPASKWALGHLGERFFTKQLKGRDETPGKG